MPPTQVSRMPLVRAASYGLLRRVAAHSNQGRNDGGARGTIPRAPTHYEGAESLRGALKSPNNITSTSVQYICFQKPTGLNMGVPHLLLAPGSI